MGITPDLYKIDHTLDNSISVSTGEPVPFSFTLYDNLSWESITHMELCMNKQVSNNRICDSDTKIIWDKNTIDGTLEIIDPNELLGITNLKISEVNGNVATFDFDVTFDSIMDTSDVQIYTWDDKRNALTFTIYNALTVMQGTAQDTNSQDTVIDDTPDSVTSDVATNGVTSNNTPSKNSIITDNHSVCVAGELQLDDGTCMVPEPGTFTCSDDQILNHDGTCFDVYSPEVQSDTIQNVPSNVLAQWAGYSSTSATDLEMLSSLDIEGVTLDEPLPNWAKKYLGEWTYKDKITSEQLKIALSYIVEYSK